MFIIDPVVLRAQVSPDSLSSPTKAVPEADTLLISVAAVDTLLSDSTAQVKPQSDSPITSPVSYNATDSIINDVVNRKVYLYGDASVTYDDITLEAERIVYDFSSYTVHAEGVQDSLGNWTGKPNFKQGDSEFGAGEMDYNFRSKKAYVKHVETDIIEGTLTGKQVKTTDDNNVIYIRHGEYCPCEDPNAHTRFKIGKLKVIKDDKIVSGPGYLSLYNVPTPLAFPFGFFPNAEKRQAGVIIPSYGNGQSQGYFLADGGFYLPIGDNVDTKILGDVYTRGSWGLENITRYKKRYKYDGNFNLQYNKNVQGDKDLSTYSEQNNFFITWRHSQDAKAKPNSSFSADINAGSSQNFQNNLNSSQTDFLTNTFRSNVRYQKGFYDSPWTMSLNASQSQNSQTGIYNFTLPDFTANRSRTFPLNGLFNDNPKQAFYEKIGFVYSGSFRNTLSVQESELALNNWDELKKEFNNGIQQVAAVSTSLKAGAVSINPSFNYTERWYFRTLGRKYDEDSQSFVNDTIQGFARNYNYNFSTSVTTKLYGMYSFKGQNLKAIRHTMTPSVTYSYRPDFDPRVYGFYGSNGNIGSYSPYQGAVFGQSPSGVSNLVTFSLVNNIEAKVLSRRDTTSKFKKIPILENITGSTSYNFAADSLRLSPINITGRTKITDYANLNFQGVFDPYSYIATESGGVIRVDNFLTNTSDKFVSFETGTIAINGAGFGSKMFMRSERGESDIIAEGEFDEDMPAVVESSGQGMFTDFSIPWNLNFGYSLSARRIRYTDLEGETYLLRDSIAINQSIQFNGDFELFKRVKVRFTSGYDFVLDEFTPTTFLINVDLNCWELNARVVPFGERRSYNLSINIRSSMLKDLKLERNRNFTGDDNFFL